MAGPDDRKPKSGEEALNPPEPGSFYGQKRTAVPVSRPDGTRPDETRVDAVLVKPEDAAHVVNVTNAFNDFIKLLLRINVDDIRIQMADAEKRAESKKIRRKIRKAVSRGLPLVIAVAGVSCAGLGAIALKSRGADLFKTFEFPKTVIASSGDTLDGASIRFICQKFSNDSTQPIDVLDYYQTSQLLSKPFQVSFNKVAATEAFPLSVAKSGWGTTVNFTNDQLLSGMPDSLNAIPVDVKEYGRAYYLPTGAFVVDPDKKASYVFTTGLVDAEGEAVNYYLTASDGNLVCDKKQRGQLPGGPNQMKATLKSQLD